jgi:DNA-binding NarL/FixJ family response regulator
MKAEQGKPLEELRAAPRVLVVDDHASFRRSVRMLRGGFEVAGEAGDEATAIRLARELRPDLVLLDVQLPDLDGFEATSRLLARDPELDVVLVSSRDRTAYGRLIDASGARGFVSKDELSGEALERLLA